MFEIRIICDPADSDRVVRELGTCFRTGPARQYPARDGRTRLYVSAEHRPTEWPTPEEAYEGAPSILDALTAVTATAADAECFTALDRDYYLHKAAVLDRIALGPGADPRDQTAAEDAAACLAGMDGAPPTAGHDSRGYVREQYALWANSRTSKAA
ncbi:hypothetical protein [Streptomyces sp. NPDC088674]|uniref:hypothetical protein n=1 Tax=Streptomyces sp. NPDC088674 TaxID=3365869 RepID=UPI00382694A4